MEKKIIELSCKTLLVDVSEYPLNFLIFPHRLIANAYVGCQHECAYCFQRWICPKNQLRVKLNAPETLRKELQIRIKRNKPKEPICFGSISDHYQPLEQEYQLMRKMLQVCSELNYPCFIVTKSSLIARDKDILSSLAKRNLVNVNFSITPIQTDLLKKLEPFAPPNKERWEAMSSLTKAGVPCSLYLSPIFPKISDKLITSHLAKASQSGAKCCAAVFLKIRPIVWKYFLPFLLNNNPELVKEYEELYFKTGNKDLSGYLLPEPNYRRKTMESIAQKCKQLNMSFTAEEYLDLWTCENSDCIDIGYHVPTAYQIIKFMKSQYPNEITPDKVIEYAQTSFSVNKSWERLLKKHWDKINRFDY